MQLISLDIVQIAHNEVATFQEATKERPRTGTMRVITDVTK